MRMKLEKLCPRYAWLPLISVLAFNLLIFFGTKLIPHEKFYDLSISLDNIIPFSKWFILVYILAFVQWVVCYITLAHGEKKKCYELCTADLIAKVICLICFITIPTAIFTRPEITGNDPLSFVTRIIFLIDTPASNLFPSIHCLESYIAIRIAFSNKKLPVWFKVITVIVSLSVFASVLFVKQHYFIDIPAGILAGEIGIIITKLTGADRIFPLICKEQEKS